MLSRACASSRLRLTHPACYKARLLSTPPSRFKTRKTSIMGKKSKRSAVPDEENLILPSRTSPDAVQIIDTHTHLLSTFTTYRSKYPDGKYATVFDFVRGVYRDQGLSCNGNECCSSFNSHSRGSKHCRCLVRSSRDSDMERAGG